jgi:hypothetical protein
VVLALALLARRRELIADEIESAIADLAELSNLAAHSGGGDQPR